MNNLFYKKNKNVNSAIDTINNLSENSKLSIYQPNTGKVAFYPSANKEWFNSIYAYNKAYTKSLVYTDDIINNLIKNYFNIIWNKVKIQSKNRRTKYKRFSVNRIFLSKAEIKHTGTKVIITLYVYNKNKIFLFYKLKNIQYRIYLRKYVTNMIFFYFSILKEFSSFKINKKQFSYIFSLLIKYFYTLRIYLKDEKQLSNISSILIKLRKFKINRKQLLSLLFLLEKCFYKSEVTLPDKNRIIYLYYNKMLAFNRFKFTSWFLNFKGLGLINLISKIYNKKVELKIINLRSIHLNSDIFSNSIVIKLKNRKNRIIKVLKKALNNVKLPSLHSILINNEISSPNKFDVLKNLRHKIVSGVRFEGSGRLTRRLTASRSICKVRYKGSLKNMYSSYNSLSSVMLRGYVKSNLQYTIINSKTRNGAFGLKGWISSH